ncbi:MAG TPA: TlpA disulfide reductase family protein, partial [bacterium]
IPDSSNVTAVGQTVPTFSVTALDGRVFNPGEEKYRALLLVFFATWCSSCNVEMPELEKQVWQRFRDRGLMVLAIGREHTKKELAVYLKDKKLSFPMAPDPKRNVFNLFATKYIPRNVLIGKKRSIVYQSVGYEPEEFKRLVAAIENELAQ